MAYRVRMFCDWDNSSEDLIWRLRSQTRHFDHNNKTGHFYKDIEFVADDSYDFAIVFNYPVQDYLTPPERTIGLLLEPPEIIPTLYPGRRETVYPQIFAMYSFCDDPPYEQALGLGFATAPVMKYVPLSRKPEQLCMIISNKWMTPYHARRHEIKDALLATDIKIDLFGRGLYGDDPRIKGEIRPMSKHSILKDYAFCMDFENSSRSVITDKFYDPIICNTVPVTNSKWVSEKYPNSVVYIDFEDSIENIVDRIRRLSFSRRRDFDLASPRHDILSGDLCLAKWISKRVEEMAK